MQSFFKTASEETLIRQWCWSFSWFLLGVQQQTSELLQTKQRRLVDAKNKELQWSNLEVINAELAFFNMY